MKAALDTDGWTPTSRVAVLADGADGLRNAVNAAVPQEPRSILDWFHISMRLRPIEQTGGSVAATDIWDTSVCCDTRATSSAPEHGPIPRGLHGVTSPTSSVAERELSLSNSMSKFDAGESNLRRAERLQPMHGSAPSLNRPVILLDDVIQVPVRSHHDVAPARVFAPQAPQGTSARPVSIDRHLPGHTG